MEKIHLNKLAVAQRQLRVAIELWVIDGDPVAIHSLAYAAHEIIHVLYKKKGHKELLFDSSLVKDEYRNEFTSFIKKDANFMKHANKDHDKTIEFNPGLSTVFLNAGIIGLQGIGVDFSDIEHVYINWLQVRHPNWFSKSIFNKDAPFEIMEEIRNLPKKEFFDLCLGVRRKLRRN